ncbi:MAG: S41 family peptidase [Streptococcaceae bacterium]|jgi:hypothetical protein|nr:S41 family peptidase [Streptococcaceae bacterium]
MENKDKIWSGDIIEFEAYIKAKTEADFEGIWDLSGAYKIGIKQENDILVGFVIDSIYDDWKPKMIKFYTKKVDNQIKTVVFYRDHSEAEIPELTLCGANMLIGENLTLHRLNSSFPDEIDLSKDASYLVEMVEQTHPIFILDGVLPNNYDECKAEYLKATSKPVLYDDFIIATLRYITTLKDGHMNLLTSTNLSSRLSKGIGVAFEYHNQKLFLSNQYNVEVTHICGIPVSEILAQIERHNFFENESMRKLHLPFFARTEFFLKLAGLRAPDEKTLSITLNKNGEIVEESTEIVDNLLNHFEPLQRDYIIKNEMINDIFYISLTKFIDGDHITKVVDEIKHSIKKGIWKYIIDLRGNGGGNSHAGERLLDAMGMSLPTRGVIRRLSKLAYEQRYKQRSIQFLIFAYFNKYIKKNKIIRKPSTKSKNRNNAFVCILTDRYSFSSSTMIGDLVQDGRLGYVIGEPSSNSPTSFGDMLYITLHVLKMRIPVSYSYWMRADVNADQETLVPDFEVSAEKALEKAIEVMSDMERVCGKKL